LRTWNSWACKSFKILATLVCKSDILFTNCDASSDSCHEEWEYLDSMVLVRKEPGGGSNHFHRGLTVVDATQWGALQPNSDLGVG
jgi:hypothetical protein